MPSVKGFFVVKRTVEALPAWCPEENPADRSLSSFRHRAKSRAARVACRGIAAATIDQRKILGAQHVVAHHPALIARRSVETEPL